MPRVAHISIERRFIQPRWDESAPVAPDLARSEGDFFRGLFDPPLPKEATRDVLARQRPSTAMGSVRARVGGGGAGGREGRDNGWEGDTWRQENVERSRQSFSKLALDATAAHPASFLEFLESELPLRTSQLQRAGTPTNASQALNRSVTQNSDRGRDNFSTHNSVREQSSSEEGYIGTAMASRRRPATQRKLHASAPHTLDSSKHSNRNRCDDGGGGKLGTGEDGAGDLRLEKSVESDDSNIVHVIMHPVSPSVRVGVPRSANGNSRQFSQHTSYTPERRCKSAGNRPSPHPPSRSVAHVYYQNRSNSSFPARSGALPVRSILAFFSMRQIKKF